MLFQTVAVADEIIPNSTPEIRAFSAVTEPTEFGNEASEAGQTDSAESNLVAEVESLRGEFEKHFINEDGSYVAVSYGYPIHYEDEDGAWQEIDNTLEEKIIGGKTKFVNKDGLFDITFE